MQIAAQLELRRLIHASARYLDDRDFQAYLGLYSEAGRYTIVTRAPELPGTMVWMQHNRTELSARIAAAPDQEWEIAEVEQTRVLSVDLLEINGAGAQASSSFALYHTDPAGVTTCYAVGRYDDCWEQLAGAWKLGSRRVVLKTRQLSMLSPLPI